MVLGRLSLDDADQLARARHGMGTTVAVALDTASWGGRGAGAGDAWQLLRAAGWAVTPLAREDSLSDAWSRVSFGGSLSAPPAPRSTAASEVPA
jgi:hypothetical protein